MKNNSIGEPLSRIDGRLKVTGGAKYAAEWDIPNMAYAVAFQSAIGSGRIVDIDTSEADKLPGVLAIITHKNVPKLAVYPAQDPKKKPEDKTETKGQAGQRLLPLQTDQIFYNGQHIGLVVAETFEQARFAASRVKVKYAEDKPTTDMERHRNRAFKAPSQPGREPNDARRGNPRLGMTAADVHVDNVYRTPVENHNPMELSATIAVWNGPNLTLYDATQGVYGCQDIVAGTLGIPRSNARVVSPFLGGGFGCKGSVWPHVILTAVAAQKVGRPVRMELTRQQMFTSVGYRAETAQRVALAATRDGKLTATIHETINMSSLYDEFVEKTGAATTMLYDCPNLEVTQKLTRLNRGTPTFMRAPGEAPGTFALESAMDELAVKLGLDPVELRLKNYAEIEPQKKVPFTSKSLRECYLLGAEKFSWKSRHAAPRSVREGDWLLGMGMATATYPTNRSESKAKCVMMADGSAKAVAATHDLGTGSYTIFTQVAADYLGVPVQNTHFELGDTNLPSAPVSGGSQSAASVGSAVKAAAKELRAKLIALAIGDGGPLSGRSADEITVEDGRMFLKTDPAKGELYADLLTRKGVGSLEADGDSKPDKEEQKKYAAHAFGAQFAAVKVSVVTGEVRVTRMVGVFAAGKILNAKTARSQLLGGMVWGMGMALHEKTVDDLRNARPMNADLAEYHVPVNADVPPIEVYTIDEVDTVVNPIGVKGIGEIGITGMAAAIANAIYNATGKRVRDLPITPDKLL